MDNHYHLLLHTPQGNISGAMRHLNGVYTQRYNQSAHTDGPLFRGRFKAILVDADSYLAQLGRYIHLNPVAAKITQNPSRYPWSSYPAYLGVAPTPRWLSLQPTLGLFGERAARKRYQAFVEAGVDPEIAAFYSKPSLAPVLGGDTFRQTLRPRSGKVKKHPETPQSKQLEAKPPLKAIMDTVAAYFDVETAALLQDGRGKGNLPRAVAMAVCRRDGGYPLIDIARAFHVESYSTVSVAVSRLNKRLSADKVLRRQVEEIMERLRTA